MIPALSRWSTVPGGACRCRRGRSIAGRMVRCAGCWWIGRPTCSRALATFSKGVDREEKTRSSRPSARWCQRSWKTPNAAWRPARSTMTIRKGGDVFLTLEAPRDSACEPRVCAIELQAEDDHQTRYRARIDRLELEDSGPLRASVRAWGAMLDLRGRHLVDLLARIETFAGSPVVRIQLTVRNPRPAGHPHGKWGLGSRGSIYFRDLSLGVMPVVPPTSAVVSCSPRPGAPCARVELPFELYQGLERRRALGQPQSLESRRPPHGALSWVSPARGRRREQWSPRRSRCRSRWRTRDARAHDAALLAELPEGGRGFSHRPHSAAVSATARRAPRAPRGGAEDPLLRVVAGPRSRLGDPARLVPPTCSPHPVAGMARRMPIGPPPGARIAG